MRILITGISGQDGVFLTRLIKSKYSKFHIVGISRSITSEQFKKVSHLQEFENNQTLELIDLNLLDTEKVDNFILDFDPDLIFNLSGPSSVYESIKNPKLKNDIIKIFDNLTNSLIKNKKFPNFYQASTSEMYGLNNAEEIYNENSKMIPNSPYGEGKYENHLKVLQFKEKFNWNIYSGIMFNHESEYRKNNYLFMKIINTAINIKEGREDFLEIGSLDYIRDWSYAKDIAEGILKITTEGSEFSYVLGSGKGTSIGIVVKTIFNFLDLDHENYIKINSSILRPNDPKVIISNPQKIAEELGWKTKFKVQDIIEKILKSKNLLQ